MRGFVHEPISHEPQFDGEDRPALGPVGRRRPAAVQLDEVFDDGQPEPRAAGIAGAARAGFVDAIEAFEDARQVALGDAWAFIGDRQPDAVAARARRP